MVNNGIRKLMVMIVMGLTFFVANSQPTHAEVVREKILKDDDIYLLEKPYVRDIKAYEWDIDKIKCEEGRVDTSVFGPSGYYIWVKNSEESKCNVIVEAIKDGKKPKIETFRPGSGKRYIFIDLNQEYDKFTIYCHGEEGPCKFDYEVIRLN